MNARDRCDARERPLRTHTSPRYGRKLEWRNASTSATTTRAVVRERAGVLGVHVCVPRRESCAPPDEAMRTLSMLVTDDGIDTLLKLEQKKKADCARTRARHGRKLEWRNASHMRPSARVQSRPRES